MKTNFTLVSSAAILLFLGSCSTQMYVSNAVNAPLLKEKGEVQLNVTQNDLQAAVAVGRNVAVMANGYYAGYRGNDDYDHNGLLGEAAVGYFTTLENDFIFEGFAGAGAGRLHKQQTFINQADQRYTASFKANAAKFFIQPDFGIKTKFFDAIVSTRFSAVKYTSFSQQNYPTDELRKDYLDNGRLTNPMFVFAEPALTARVGYKYLKLQLQYGLTINVTGNPIRHPANFSSLGLVIDIGKWYNDED